MQAKDALKRAISGAGDALIRLSHVIHERPETAFEEHYAAGRVADRNLAGGFVFCLVRRCLGMVCFHYTAGVGTG